MRWVCRDTGKEKEKKVQAKGAPIGRIDPIDWSSLPWFRSVPFGPIPPFHYSSPSPSPSSSFFLILMSPLYRKKRAENNERKEGEPLQSRDESSYSLLPSLLLLL